VNANTQPFRPRKKSAASPAQTDLTQIAGIEESSSAPGPDATNSAAVSLPPETPSADVKSDLAVAESITESPVRTALAVVSAQVDAIQAMDVRVSELEVRYTGVIFQVETTAGMTDAKKAREEIRESRYALQNMLRDGKAPLNNLKRHMEETTTARIERLLGIETPIDSQIKAEEQRKEDEKKAKAEAERKRVAAIEERITDIRESVTLAAGKSSEEIAGYIASLDALAIDHTFAEFQQRAQMAKDATLMRLRTAHKAAVDLEAEQKRLAEKRAELAAEQARQERLSAVRKRIDAIRNYVDGARLEAAEQVSERIARARALVVDESFEELREEAEGVRQDTVQTLVDIHGERVVAEAEAQRLREQEAAAQAERDRLAEQQRQLDARKAEQDAEEVRQRQEREAEEQRLADQRADLERQQAALKAAQEEAAAREPDAIINGAQVNASPFAAAPAPDPMPLPAAGVARWRPKDDAVIHLVAKTYNVPHEVARGWIVDIAGRLASKDAA
jgi:hypothetical protein